MTSNFRRILQGLGACVLALICSDPLRAQTGLHFDELRDGEAVEGFYRGGFGSLGSGPGPEAGVAIDGATVRIGREAGGSGDFTGEPSPSGALFATAIATINSTDGFKDRTSFFYVNPWATTEVRLFDGPDLTGRILAIRYFAPTPQTTAGEAAGPTNRFIQAEITFTGVARSIGVLSRGPGGVYLDDLTLGEAPPARIPPRYTLLDLGPASEGVQRTTNPHVNRRGQLFVQTNVPNIRATRVVFWDPEGDGGVDLGTFGGPSTLASDINDGGQIVGWSYFPDLTIHAFIWTMKTGMVELGGLGGANSMAAGLNDAGQVVGWASPAGEGEPFHAVLWQNGVMTDLNDLVIANRDGWQLLERAYSISDNGVIVGSGLASTDDQVVHRYFVLRPTPR